jgi:FtsH-binding integral membrane protein
MRVYFIPFVAGIVLTISAFLPWVIVAEVSLSGVPDIAGLWVVGLGVLASVLAILSLITRRNSRHPLLVVGLVALGITLLAWRIMPRMAGERARTMSDAYAIVEDRPFGAAPPATAGSGIYVGMAAASVIVAFGLTIVIRRASTPYTVAMSDDDV